MITKILLFLKTPINILFLISFIQVLSFPILQYFPAPNKFIYDYGIILNNMSLSYLAGYIFYLLTILFPYNSRRKIAIGHLKLLSGCLEVKITCFEKPIINILVQKYGEKENQEKLNLKNFDRLIEILNNIANHDLISNNINNLIIECKTLMPQINYIVDQMLFMREFISDELFNELMILKNPNYHLFSVISTNMINIAVTLNYQKNYFIDLYERIKKIQQLI